MPVRKSKILELLLVVAVLLNILTWFHGRFTSAKWLNVPSVPSHNASSVFALGDQQFSYRVIGNMLQNLGDTGGRSTALRDYDYERLSGWFFLADKLRFSWLLDLPYWRLLGLQMYIVPNASLYHHY